MDPNPTPPSNPQVAKELIERSDSLDRAKENLPDPAELINTAKSVAHQTKFVSKVSITLSIMVIVVSAVLAFVSLKAYSNSKEISKTNAYAVADASNLAIICERANADLAKQKAIFDFIISQIGQPSGSPALADALEPSVDEIPTTDPSRAVWDKLLEALRTPGSNALVEGLRPLVAEAFSQRNCNPANAPEPEVVP